MRETIIVTDNNSRPQCPDWLTAEGEVIWLEHADKIKNLIEIDTVLWAHYCNLAGSIISAWRCNEPPPVTYITELRRLSELFGIGGPKTRVGNLINGSQETNPFARFKREPNSEK